MTPLVESLQDPLPLGRDAQRAVEREWRRTVYDRIPPRGVRAVVRASWERCLSRHVAPRMPAAPMVLDENALHAHQEEEDWLGIARQTARQHPTSFSGPGHILALFDREGRMLASEGDERALERLAEINFRPGGHWSEAAVGTNGPGTALAMGAPAHIVGAEHFCSEWHIWHCAAVPVRDPATGEIVGALDISGERDRAHPHALNVALALAMAIEQGLLSRNLRHQLLTIEHFSQLHARYPADLAVEVDRYGRILMSSAGFPDGMRDQVAAAELRAIVAELVRRPPVPTPAEVPLVESARFPATGVWQPVVEQGKVVGGFLSFPMRSSPRISKPARANGRTRYTFADLLGVSASVEGARQRALAAARTDFPVLLLGESGTGKELFAQAIHDASARRDHPFVAVNCAAIPRELVESEMFGYAAGAFTGARREGGQGKFEAADGGTIFLDEIAELSPAAQATLLRVLEESEITRVGSTSSRPIDVRVIAATNRPVESLLDSGAFREDLYHRLNVLPIELPPLRDREGDVPFLANRFVENAARELGRFAPAIEPAAMAALRAYRWPGNVRELRNLMRRLVANCASVIRVSDLPAFVRDAAAALSAAPPRVRVDAVATVEATSTLDAEDAALIRAVTEASTMAEAAARLGITRSTLYRRMSRFGMRPRKVVERERQ